MILLQATRRPSLKIHDRSVIPDLPGTFDSSGPIILGFGRLLHHDERLALSRLPLVVDLEPDIRQTGHQFLRGEDLDHRHHPNNLQVGAMILENFMVSPMHELLVTKMPPG